LVKPFIPLAKSHEPITTSPPVEGFEGAGMGKIVTLKERMSLHQATKMVKDHLGLKYGTLLDL